MTLAEGLTIVALLAGPIAAVQIQKHLDLIREERGRKIWIFKTLMATRAAVLTPEHVQALNMIDLEFRGEEYRNVTGAWKTYLDHLSSFPKDDKTREPVWSGRSVDLQVALLIAMGRALGYAFDDVQVKKGIYFPEAHGTIDTEIKLIRRGLVEMLFGERALKMNVTGFPTNPEATAAQKAFIEAMSRLAQRVEGLEKNRDA